MPDPEALARQHIDTALAAAGWVIQDRDAVNMAAAAGVAVREFPLKTGEADYLLYAAGKAVGVVEAKPVGHSLTGVETQSAKYGAGLPDYLPAWHRPLPMLYESTGVETHFTNLLDPDPRSRSVFAFHRPETIANWLRAAPAGIAVRGGIREDPASYQIGPPPTLRDNLRQLPPLDAANLWSAQREAVTNLERALADGANRALIQMATGSGKTFTAITAIYRLIKYGGARRVLFLVDRANLGRQALKEFQQYKTPDDGRTFAELYNVQLLGSNHVDQTCRVVITTIQRLYAMLQGKEDLDPDQEEESGFDGHTYAALTREPVPVAYNPAIPIETFDVIFTDECHRSIYHLWRQVLEYFDAHLIGLTATPSKQTIGFFHKNLVMAYTHEQAVADGVNVGFDVYQIKTRITEQGATVDADYWIDKRDRLTRARRMALLDEEFTYAPHQLDRSVVAMDQIRTVIRAFKDKLFTEIFPGRSEVPKTLIFAKDDMHADDIVQVVREVFGRGNDFAVKITYKTTGAKPEDLISQFRTGYDPRVAVTVDMIATGTDIKPVEIVMFMRTVKSPSFFEQMKGRGSRVIDSESFRDVVPDATHKERFVIVDCVGVTDQTFSESRPLDRKKGVPFERLLEAVAFGSTDADVLSSLAARLAQTERALSPAQHERITTAGDGATLKHIVGGILDALDPDRIEGVARMMADLPSDAVPDPALVAAARDDLLRQAVAPLATNVGLRNAILDIRRENEQTIDTVSLDEVLSAGYSADATERARALTRDFRAFIDANRDEIDALSLLYHRPYAQRLNYRQIKTLADALTSGPRPLQPESVWRAYETLDRSRVRGTGGKMLADVVALVRFSLEQEDELIPHAERVRERFTTWLAERETGETRFTAEQRQWLERIRDHVAASLAIERADFEEAPFNQHGGLGRVYQLFGADLDELIDELNEVLAA